METGGVLKMLQSLPPPSLHACDNCHHAYPDPPDFEDTGAQNKAQGPWLASRGGAGGESQSLTASSHTYTPHWAVDTVLGQG